MCPFAKKKSPVFEWLCGKTISADIRALVSKLFCRKYFKYTSRLWIRGLTEENSKQESVATVKANRWRRGHGVKRSHSIRLHSSSRGRRPRAQLCLLCATLVSAVRPGIKSPQKSLALNCTASNFLFTILWIVFAIVSSHLVPNNDEQRATLELCTLGAQCLNVDLCWMLSALMTTNTIKKDIKQAKRVQRFFFLGLLATLFVLAVTTSLPSWSVGETTVLAILNFLVILVHFVLWACADQTQVLPSCSPHNTIGRDRDLCDSP